MNYRNLSESIHIQLFFPENRTDCTRFSLYPAFLYATRLSKNPAESGNRLR